MCQYVLIVKKKNTIFEFFLSKLIVLPWIRTWTRIRIQIGPKSWIRIQIQCIWNHNAVQNTTHCAQHQLTTAHNSSQQLTTAHNSSKQLKTANTAHNSIQQHTTPINSSQQHTTAHTSTKPLTTAHNSSQQLTTAHNGTHSSQQLTIAHNGSQQHTTPLNSSQHTTHNCSQLHTQLTITAQNTTHNNSSKQQLTTAHRNPTVSRLLTSWVEQSGMERATRWSNTVWGPTQTKIKFYSLKLSASDPDRSGFFGQSGSGLKKPVFRSILCLL